MSSGINVADTVVSQYEIYKLKGSSTLTADQIQNPYFFLVDKDDKPIEKIIFISWVPDTSKIKEKMLYASFKDYLKLQLNGVNFEIQASDYHNIFDETITEEINRERYGIK